MKLGDFLLVESIVDARNRLIELRDEGRLQLTINNKAQDAAMLDCIRGAVRDELDNRIGELEVQLVKLGVEIE
jgi:hypothetical protein